MLCIFIFIAIIDVISGSPFNSYLDKEWMLFKKTYNKNYREKEEYTRRGIWEENVMCIQKHNLAADRGQYTYTLGMNKYGDMTNEEFNKVMNGFKLRNATGQGRVFLRPNNVNLPDTVDWRDKGYVTPVKDQGSCGSCWAFSATGSLEGQHYGKTGNLVSLSEQNLMDCSQPQGNEGCNGGWPDQAFKYIQQNKGIDTEADYPYLAKTQYQCHFSKSNIGATVRGIVDIQRGSENALQEAVATVGPVSVGIDASQTDFHLYKHGVYSTINCSTTVLDHAVLVVGYGTENGQDYWLVKNSWGIGWGEQGYIKMSRNKNNMCGIASKASYPDV